MSDARRSPVTRGSAPGRSSLRSSSSPARSGFLLQASHEGRGRVLQARRRGDGERRRVARKKLQVHGNVVDGSIEQAKGTLLYRFKIESRDPRPPAVITATLHRPGPRHVQDGAEVVAKGTLTADNELDVVPDGIMAKCPSKYDADKTGRRRPPQGRQDRGRRPEALGARHSRRSPSGVAQAVDGAQAAGAQRRDRASPGSRSPASPRRPPAISAAAICTGSCADQIDLRVQRVAVERAPAGRSAARRRSRAPVPTAAHGGAADRGRCAPPSPDGAPIDFRIAISRTLDSTIIVSDAMMLNAATTMMSTSSSEMITFCMVSAMNRLWFSSFQSMTR